MYKSKVPVSQAAKRQFVPPKLKNSSEGNNTSDNSQSQNNSDYSVVAPENTNSEEQRPLNMSSNSNTENEFENSNNNLRLSDCNEQKLNFNGLSTFFLKKSNSARK